MLMVCYKTCCVNICECYNTVIPHPWCYITYLNSYITDYITCYKTSFAQFCNMCLLTIISTDSCTVIMDSGFSNQVLPAFTCFLISLVFQRGNCFSVLSSSDLGYFHRLGTCRCSTELQQQFQHHLGWEKARILDSTKQSYQQNNSANQSSRVHWHQQLYWP